MVWLVYLARCADGTLYAGVTTDTSARLAAHNSGQGAKYTRTRGPVTLVYEEKAPNRSAALRREWAIKRLARTEKERLIGRARAGSTEEAMNDFDRFRPAALDFFKRLKRRNTKAWFEKHRDLYQREVKQPLQALVEAMDVRFARMAPEIIGDPRRSVFRIHRDIRFSRDKSPYKTHAACWFYHQAAGKGVGGEAAGGGAGFYLHLAPEECFVGGGIWMPPRASLQRIRDAIVERQSSFEAVARRPGFRRRFGNFDDAQMLKRLPRGYAPGHPAERWLRYQSFTVGRTLSRRELLSPRLPEILSRDFQALLPLVRWLNSALGYAPASSRV